MAVSANSPVSAGNLAAVVESLKSSGGGGGLFDGMSRFSDYVYDSSGTEQFTIPGTSWTIKGVSMPVNAKVSGFASEKLVIIKEINIWASGSTRTWMSGGSQYVNVSNSSGTVSFCSSNAIGCTVGHNASNNAATCSLVTAYGDNGGYKFYPKTSVTASGSSSSVYPSYLCFYLA